MDFAQHPFISLLLGCFPGMNQKAACSKKEKTHANLIIRTYNSTYAFTNDLKTTRSGEFMGEFPTTHPPLASYNIRARGVSDSGTIFALLTSFFFAIHECMLSCTLDENNVLRTFERSLSSSTSHFH